MKQGKRTVAAELFKLLENVAVSTKAHQSSADSQLQHTHTHTSKYCSSETIQQGERERNRTLDLHFLFPKPNKRGTRIGRGKKMQIHFNFFSFLFLVFFPFQTAEKENFFRQFSFSRIRESNNCHQSFKSAFDTVSNRQEIEENYKKSE